MPQDAIDQWYADGPSDSKEQRMIDLILIGPHVGACLDCGWRRIRAEYELWDEVVGEKALRDIQGDEPERLWPHCSCTLLCTECTAERRAQPQDPDIRIVLIRPLRWSSQ